MKKINSILCAVSVSLVMTACSTGSENESENKASDSVSLSAEQPQNVTLSAPTQQTGNASTNAAAEGINPPHGQPGHRCDIPDGAPLNSQPKTNSTNTQGTISPQIQTAISPVIQTPVQTTEGMNPAHGEPGHDCSIPVGSPLKK